MVLDTSFNVVYNMLPRTWHFYHQI